jgi:PAS domain S-box-containing protein
MHVVQIAMLEALPEPAFVVEAEGRRVIAVNERARLRLGLIDEAWTGVDFTEISRCPDSKLARIERVIRGEGGPVTVSLRLVGGRGELGGLLTVSHFQNDGGSYGLCLFRADSVPSNGATDTLYRRLRELFDYSNDLIFTQDVEGRVTSINPAGSAMFGYGETELIGSRAEHLIEESSLRQAIERYAAIYDSGRPTPSFELQCRTRTGEPVWLEMSVLKLIEDGTVQGTLGMGRNITERKRAEFALLQSQQLLEEQKTLLARVIEQNPYAIAIWKPDGELEQCNNAFVKLIGTVPGAGYNLLRDRQALEAGIEGASGGRCAARRFIWNGDSTTSGGIRT